MLDNVLSDGAQVTGVIDWAGGTVGDPRHDLALATQARRGAFERPEDLEAFYAGYRGARLSPQDAEYFLGLDEFF
jgi:aminoglycoside phosphotransferase (APT) family kinase protein